MTRRRILLTWLGASSLLIATTAFGQEDAQAKKDGLVGSVASKLEISESQAEAGTAAALSLAKNKLGGSEFDLLSKALPEMDSILGRASSLDITSMTGLMEHLEGLGLSDKVAQGFGPAVADYVEGQLGGAKTRLLKSVLSRKTGS